MVRSEIFVIGFILAFAFNCVECSSDEIDSNIQIAVVENMDDFMVQNPGLYAQELQKFEGPSQKTRLTYRIGGRINGKLTFSLLFFSFD